MAKVKIILTKEEYEKKRIADKKYEKKVTDRLRKAIAIKSEKTTNELIDELYN